MQNIETKY